MSIMMDQVISDGFLRRSKLPPTSSLIGSTVDRTVAPGKIEIGFGSGSGPCDSSSSSSIGMNSDDEKDDCVKNGSNDDNDDDEVESKLMKNSTFDSVIDDLEQALPMRRGISKFYSGKSKSFASLGDTACSSIKDITKAENAYSRKRKNLLATSLLYSKGRTSLLKSPRIGGGIGKKSTSANRSTLAFANAIDENGSFVEINESENSRTPSLSPPSSPVPPPPWRSFSLADLQHCSVSTSALNS